MAWSHYLMTNISRARAAREGSFGFLIQTLARRIDARMKEELKAEGGDIKVFTLLMTLREEDGINQRQLGAKLSFPEYFTSRNVDALVAAGYAERQQDPNSRRSFLVFLTDKGRETAERLPMVVRRVNDETLAHLTEAERKRAVVLLQKVAGIGPGAET